MHRSETFMYNLGEEILMGMEKMDKNITPAQLTTLASMADDYNKLCKFVEKHSKHKINMDKMDAGEYHAADNLRPAMAAAKNPY